MKEENAITIPEEVVKNVLRYDMRKEYTAHILESEDHERAFLACLSNPPDFPDGVELAPDMMPHGVLVISRTPEGFRWTVFEGEVKAWKEPIGFKLMEAGKKPGEWVWMELREKDTK